MAIFGKSLRLGFWVRDDVVDAAIVQPRRTGLKVLVGASVLAENLLVADGRQARLAAAFQLVMKRLGPVSRRADMPAILALPDRLVEEEVLAFAEFPSSKRQARALVAQRMARELGTAADDIEVTWEVFGSSDNRVTCRARAMERALRDDIEGAAAATGLRLIRIDSWNGFASGAPDLGEEPSGAAVWSDGKDWSLLCWQSGEPAGFAQSGRSEDVGEVAATVARLSVSFAKRHGMTPGKLFISVPGDAIRDFETAAKGLGLSVVKSAPGTSPAAQVAAWG